MEESKETKKIRRRELECSTMANAGLEAMEGLVIETILSKLDARDVAAVSCVSTRLRSAASDDVLWRLLIVRDLDVVDPVDPDGNPCPSFKEAYRKWIESFGMYPLPLVRRVKQCWTSLRGWLAVNFPEASNTLRKGASEAEIKWAEDTLGVKLPVATKVLYRFCDGQQTLTPYPDECQQLASFGIIGGYEFYDHRVNVHLLPLKQAVAETKPFARQFDSPTSSKFMIVAASWYVAKLFFLNCANAQLYVGTTNLFEDGEMMPCVPQELIMPAVGGNGMPQDALFLWLEEHCRRLQGGIIGTRVLGNSPTISLYPEAPPSCSVAVTNGVQVRASAVLVPEDCDLSEEAEGKYLYSYSIRMSLLSDGCLLDGVYYPSCQICSLHLIIRSGENVVSDLNGEAVTGTCPLLFPNKEEFVYESSTPLPDAPGSVEGYFTFVPGRMHKPEGRQFNVKVPRFILEEPKYIF